MGGMKAEDAAEMMDQERARDKFKQRAAVAIAFFAMLLAITGLGGQNATKDALNSNVEASNYWNFFQAKNMRQTAYMLAADEIEAAWLATPGLTDEARNALKEKASRYRATVARYESEPETNEGKKELVARAKETEARRDHALRQDPYFDYAEALLQIAIVLISVAIVADVVWLSFFGGAIGVLGGLLMINGFTLWVTVPFLG
jgi:hypothetical protein